MSSCQNVALKECFSRVAVSNSFEELLSEYNVNFSLSLYAVHGAVYSTFASICDKLFLTVCLYSVVHSQLTRGVDSCFYLFILSLPSDRSEWRSMCVCVCICAQWTGQSDRFKTLKVRTSNLACMFPGTVRTWHLINFSKRGRGQGHFLAVKC